MDEPLSNLDAKLRVEMRNAIKRIQQQIGITTVYVTHDQEEALAVSDRIAVMHNGIIQQVGSPQHIYQRPTNQFVATFIGLSNMIKAKLVDAGGVPALDFGKDYVVPMANLNLAPVTGGQTPCGWQLCPVRLWLCPYAPRNLPLPGAVPVLMPW
jgi:iron(III) transport system ATP-binding protein